MSLKLTGRSFDNLWRHYIKITNVGLMVAPEEKPGYHQSQSQYHENVIRKRPYFTLMSCAGWGAKMSYC